MQDMYWAGEAEGVKAVTKISCVSNRYYVLHGRTDDSRVQRLPRP